MKYTKTTFKVIAALSLLGIIGGGLWSLEAQTSSQKEQIMRHNNQEALKNIVQRLDEEQHSFKAAAKHLPTSFKKSNKDLVGFGPDGAALYYQALIESTETAVSNWGEPTSTPTLNGEVITGENMEIGIWDRGLPRNTHQELQGKIELGDQSSVLNYSHATMVSGIVLAKGENDKAKGIASQAAGKAFDWVEDRKEAAEQASLGLLISNHSYGISANNLPSWYFGAYIRMSRDWDDIQYNAPYYLMISAAGNHGEHKDGVLGFNTSKNGLSVGASLSEMTHEAASFSAYGPTDDGRIKPDLVAPGADIFSSSGLTDESYAVGSGTSYSTPKASGTALLLQEAFEKTKGRFLRAASLKGLMIHTALDIDLPGPDYQRGWGVLQQDQGIAFIEGMDKGTKLIESELLNESSETYEFEASETGLKITLSWTDIPTDYMNLGVINPKKSMLVHDLDLRVYKDGELYEPFILNPEMPYAMAATGDNFRDPIEQIQVFEAGNYRLKITHKASLQSPQKFSLLISGIAFEPEVAESPNSTQTPETPPHTVEDNNNLHSQLSAHTSPIIPPETTAEISVNVYPNPTAHELHVEGLNTRNFKYHIYHSDGSIATSGRTKNGKVPVNKLADGFYILGIFHKTGYKAVKFFKH